MFLKILSDKLFENTQKALDLMDARVDTILHSLEEVMNEFLLKSNGDEYERFYAEVQQVENWNKFLNKEGYGDIGKSSLKFVVPLSRFLNEYGLDIALFNRINEEFIHDTNSFLAVTAVFNDLHQKQVRLDAVPFDITVSTQGNNLVQIINQKKRNMEDNIRIEDQKEISKENQAIQFSDHLSEDSKKIIGNQQEFLRFTKSPYFKFWDFKLLEMFKGQHVSIIDMLTKYLERHGLILAQFNDLCDLLITHGCSMSNVETAFNDLHALGHECISEIRPDAVLTWIEAIEIEDTWQSDDGNLLESVD